MLDWWQHLPLQLDPIAFSVGFFSVYWYAIFYLIGFAVALWYLLRQRRKVPNILTSEETYDMAITVFLGALIGGRIGFALFYAPDFYLAHPYRLFLPYDFTFRQWTGISGMSFHGGLIGGILTLSWFVFNKKLSFWHVLDFAVPSIPLALFFGRLGNFFNGELFGRPTSFWWGMYFPEGGGVLRHPSSLYEALLEGILLFAILFLSRRKSLSPGMLAVSFLGWYAIFRFAVEYVREPDPGVILLFGVLTRGQVLSVGMFTVAVGIFFWLKGQKNDKISREA